MEVPIIGRDRELAELRADLVAASGGAGRLVLISGEQGIGKTRLVSAIEDMAGEYDIPAAHGRAIDDPGMPPLWPWQQLAGAVPALAGVAEREAGDGAAAAGDSAAARFLMFARISQALVDAAAARGLVVILEDLQWADRTSLLLLRHLAGELARTRLLVAATFREPADPPLTSLLPALLSAGYSAGLVRQVRLSGLSRPDIARWLRQLGATGDIDGQAGRLRERTSGNPLFVRMLAESGQPGTGDDLRGLPGLRHLVLARLDGIGGQGRDLLDAASVLGERVDPLVLAEVTGLPAAEVGALLDQAVAQGVLHAAPDTAGLSFVHSLVRDVVYDELAPSRRMALHERTALALELSGNSTVYAGQIAGQIASHWRRSGGPDWAGHCLRWAREAARLWSASLAYDEAARFAALALEAAQADPQSAGAAGASLRAELAVEAARAEFAAGRIEESVAHCQEAALLAEQAGRPAILAAAALVITGIGDPATVTALDQLCARAIRTIPPQDPALRARLLARRAIFAAETGAGNRARELSARALALAGSSGDPDALLDGIHARHLSLSAPQYLTERHALATQACEIAQRARRPLAELWGHVWLVDAEFQAGDLAAVDRELDQIEQLAADRRQPIAWWHLHRLRATRAALVGELDSAVAHNEAARAAAARIGAVSSTGMYYVFLIRLGLLRGGIDRDTGEAVLAMLRQVPGLPIVRIFIPITHLLLGQRDLARTTFEEFRHTAGNIEVGPRWAALLVMIGMVAVLLDDTETADRVYRELSPVAPCYAGDGSGLVFSEGSTQRLIADLALATGRTDEAIGRYADAIAMNARIGARPFLALGRLGLARALMPSDLPAARTHAAEAAAEFRRLDLPGPLAEADSLLACIDAAERSASPLSPRETEVAGLIAQAMSNRQIADRLVLSERTVETHVRNILAKLGVATRVEIATWARP
jgi:DNA-binding CsgD family transcriptional regulator